MFDSSEDITSFVQGKIRVRTHVHVQGVFAHSDRDNNLTELAAGVSYKDYDALLVLSLGSHRRGGKGVLGAGGRS